MFGNLGDCIGIMSKLSGYVLADRKRTFIITMVYPPYNYDFVNAAMFRTDDEIICYRSAQLYDSWRNEYPPLAYSP